MATFSNTATKSGIVEQVRQMARLDSQQLSNEMIANSSNNWLDKIAGYAIGADNRFNWDDTNHTKLPIGTTNIIANQADYSFLVDEQGNKIITLLRIDIKDSHGNWVKLQSLDESEVKGALDEFESTTGAPKYYDKIADNVIRLYPTPNENVTGGIKFYFQRTPSYFLPTDTTKEPGVSPLLHRGFIIAGAYDAAVTFSLSNLQPLSVELQKEEEKIKKYFSTRNKDEVRKIRPYIANCR